MVFFIFWFIAVITLVWLVGIVAIFVLPEVGLTSKTKPIFAKYTIPIYQQVLTKYFQDNGIYPTTNQGLRALVDKPTTFPIPEHYPKGGYFEKPVDFIDPWGNSYQYTYQLVNGEHEITIISLGADGNLGGKGDQADIVSVCKHRSVELPKCIFSSSF